MFSYQSNITQGRRNIKRGRSLYIHLIKQLNIPKTYVPSPPPPQQLYL